MPTLQNRARIIDGTALAATVKTRVGQRVQALRADGITVRLDTVLVGGTDASRVYAESQARTCDELGIECVLHDLPADSTSADVEDVIRRLNEDPLVKAIMMHLPLPEGLNTERLQAAILPSKDVEGVNPANIGNTLYGRRSLVPCTARAVMEMIESTGITLPGARCVVVGASNIVGKPVVVLLMRAEATVISTNIHTFRQEELTRTADVLVAAAGVRELITADMVKPGAVVIDVGIHRIREPDGGRRTVGDVRFDEVSEVAAWLSPVPGGVGPMTVAMLLRNTVEAATPDA